MHALEVEFIQNPKEIRKIPTYETRDVVDYTGHTVLLEWNPEGCDGWAHTFCITEMKYLMFTTNVLWLTEDKDYIVLDCPYLLVGKGVGNFPDMALDYAYLTQIVN